MAGPAHPRGLRKHATQLRLAGARPVAVLGGPALRLGAHQRHARAVDLDVEHRDRWAHQLQQFELGGPPHRGLLERCDVSADGLGMAFHGLGADLQSG